MCVSGGVVIYIYIYISRFFFTFSVWCLCGWCVSGGVRYLQIDLYILKQNFVWCVWIVCVSGAVVVCTYIYIYM